MVFQQAYDHFSIFVWLLGLRNVGNGFETKPLIIWSIEKIMPTKKNDYNQLLHMYQGPILNVNDSSDSENVCYKTEKRN